MKLGTQPLDLGQDAPATPPAAPAVHPSEPPSEPQAPAHAIEQSVAVREVLGFPMRLIPQLPLPSTLLCADGKSGIVVLTTSGEVRQRCAELTQPCFAGVELQVLAVGAEQDRAWPADMKRWCVRKLQEPSYELTVGEVFAGVAERIAAQGWTVGRVLDRLGLRLLLVEAGTDEGIAILTEGGRGV